MRKLVTWFAKRLGITQAWMDAGYDHGWRASRAHPEIADENRRVPFAG